MQTADLTSLTTSRECGPVPALPESHIATAPPEVRGTPRDSVRMLVATAHGLTHRLARQLPNVLRAGDVLVINTSDTLPAALPGVTSGGERVEVHLSTLQPDAGMPYEMALAQRRSRWVVEVRTHGPLGGEPSYADRAGELIRFGDAGSLRIDDPYPAGAEKPRLWTAELVTPAPLLGWLHHHGDPIRYRYVSAPWRLAAYRTPYADTPGSAEMPSAGRALTPRVFRRLRARGVEVADVLLHCGVSSLEAGDPPYPEWFEVRPSTAATVEAARRDGRRVIAVGTTVVRALESAARVDGTVRAARGWTDLVITPERGVSTVDGLLSGWHEPEASHLQMLAAVAGCDLLQASYAEAAKAGYRSHEFGDLHLILPSGLDPWRAGAGRGGPARRVGAPPADRGIRR
jgi:S-adenosylmethionine:tRNA ribosyltransferase-isomerase